MSMDTMTPRERMQALLKKEPIDRIPVSASASLYAARISGILYKEYWTDPVQSFRAQSLAAELHGYDDTPSYSYGWSDWAGWDFGGDIRIPEEDSGYPEVMNRPVQKPEDIDKLITPDPRIAPVSSMRLKAAKMNWEKSGKVSLNVNVTSMVGSIIGNEKMMRWYHTEPSSVHALYRKATDYSLAIFELYFQEFGAENCSVMETFPLDSQNVISTEIFSRFGYKYIKEINEFMCNAG